jgi:hypothetical protein
VRELVDVASAGADRRVADAGRDVFESEHVVGEPGDLEDDSPRPAEAGDVDLQAARKTSARWVFGVAVAALGRPDAVALVATAGRVQRSSSGFG